MCTVLRAEDQDAAVARYADDLYGVFVEGLADLVGRIIGWTVLSARYPLASATTLLWSNQMSSPLRCR